MQYNNFIDSIAAVGKFGIEASGHLRDDKELAKAKVDCLASILKTLQPFPEKNPNTLSINFESVRQIKTIARQYSVDKVVLFPYPVGNQNIVSLMRAYGGEAAKFFEAIGFNPLRGNNITAEERVGLERWEKEYGIILYESC